MTVPIVADLAAYRVAIAALPLQAHPATDVAGAIAVLDGAGRWWTAAAEAVAAGAVAVLVAEPRDVPLEAARELLSVEGAPILVHRSRLRADLVSRAVEQRHGVPPRLVFAECRANASGIEALVRDAAGWMRELSSSTLSLPDVTVPSGGGNTLLRSDADNRVVGTMSITVSGVGGTLLRVTALGEVVTELAVDEAVDRVELTTAAAGGRLVVPRLFEAGERVALRRAVAASGRPASHDDLRGLICDAETAQAIFTGAGPSLVAF